MTKVVLHTAGNGLWNEEERNVRITNMLIGYIDDDFAVGKHPTFGELRVYFDCRTWDVQEHGLIYTDRLFMRELRAFLDTHGLVGKDVDYSEQGMQGADYVSCDVGGRFLKAWGKKFGLDWEKAVRDPRGIRVACIG